MPRERSEILLLRVRDILKKTVETLHPPEILVPQRLTDIDIEMITFLRQPKKILLILVYQI
jgi:hypothetical protein